MPASLYDVLMNAKHFIPPPGNPAIFRDGIPMLTFAGPRSWMIEAWVATLAKREKIAMDWSFFGGRAVVRALPKDEARAREVLSSNLEDLKKAAQDAYVLKDEGAYPMEALRWL